MIRGFNPLEDWWKMSSYSKKHHYFWLMPIIAICWVFIWLESRISKIVQRLKHKHNFVKIGYRQTEDRFERYSIRHYHCQACGKEKWVDGRYDTINKDTKL